MTVLSNIWTNEAPVIRKVRQGPVLVCQKCGKSHTKSIKMTRSSEFAGILLSQHHLIVFSFLADSIHLRAKTCKRLSANIHNDQMTLFCTLGISQCPVTEIICVPINIFSDGTSVSTPVICKPRPRIILLNVTCSSYL